MKEVQIPEAKGIDRTQLLQNVWISMNAAKPYRDNAGQQINECPQDLMIPTRFIHMFKPAFKWESYAGACLW